MMSFDIQRSCRFLVLPLILVYLPGCSIPWELRSRWNDSHAFDAGVVATSARIDHVFEIANDGSRPLRLTGVRTSCGCSGAVLDENPIAPGKKGFVQMSLHPDGAAGRKVADAVVLTDDPERPKLNLRMQCDFRPALHAAPGRFELGTFPAGQQHAAEAEIRVLAGSGTQVFKITAVETGSAPGFSARVETIREGVEYRVALSSDTPLAQGAYDGKVVIRTDLKGLTELEVPVTGAGLGAVAVQPDAVFLKRSEHDEDRQDYILRVVSGTVDDFRVLGVSAPGGATARIEVRHKHTVVRLHGLRGECLLQGQQVRIFTDAVGAEELTVPLKIRGCEATAHAQS